VEFKMNGFQFVKMGSVGISFKIIIIMSH